MYVCMYIYIYIYLRIGILSPPGAWSFGEAGESSKAVVRGTGTTGNRQRTQRYTESGYGEEYMASRHRAPHK